MFKKILKRYKRLIIAILGASVLWGSFYIYRDELASWTCHEEENGASCFILAKNLLEENKPDLAKNYFDKACKYKYKPACSFLEE